MPPGPWDLSGLRTLILGAECTDPGDAWHAAVTATARKVFPARGLRVVNGAARRIASTTSGKPRRQETWRRLVGDGVVGTGARHETWGQ